MAILKLESYAQRYRHVTMERRDGILQATLHTGGAELAVRYARVAMTQQLKELMLENLGYGLALEGLSAAASWPGAKG